MALTLKGISRTKVCLKGKGERKYGCFVCNSPHFDKSKFTPLLKERGVSRSEMGVSWKVNDGCFVGDFSAPLKLRLRNERKKYLGLLFGDCGNANRFSFPWLLLSVLLPEVV